MSFKGYEFLRVERRGRIVVATIDNPPINLLTLPLFGELARLSSELEADRDALVFILRSANPDFFIAHFDVAAILQFPIEQAATREDARGNTYHAMCERFRTMNKVTIAQIEGRVGGGGSELAMSFDMRFGVRGKSIVNQMEVPIGILPGGSGTQRLPRLIGRGRALEVIMGGIDLDAETGERWGYFNRIFEADEIGPFVDGLAARVASFPPDAVRLAKQAIDRQRAARRWATGGKLSVSMPAAYRAAQRNMKKFLAMGGQTREGELKVAELSVSVAKGPAN